MASFRVPCNWDDKLIDELAGAEVSSIYGMLPSHVAGGGRPSAALPQIGKDAAQEYIKAARAKGYSFNYLFNAPCIDAQEFTDLWRKRFLKHLDWAVDVGVEMVTVAVPYLIEVIKKHNSKLKISVSSYARVNSLRRAVYFQDLGVDDITLDPISMNRNFRCLEAMTNKLGCTVTLIANGICLYQCPFAEYHGVLMGHSSQENHPSGGRYEEYPFYNCTLRKLSNPSEIIRAGFIRPDDLKIYEEIGITNFKLVDRTRPTAWLSNTLKAYIEGKYDGDLLQILNFPHFFLSLLYKQSGMEGAPVFPQVANRELDGFIEHLRKVDCPTQDCDSCNICREYAERAVKMPKGVEKLVQILNGTLDRLNFG